MDEEDIKRARAERRHQAFVDRETAPSYWSAFSGWQWLAAIALVVAVVGVLNLIS